MKIVGFRPRPSQLEVLKSPVRFKVVSAGRRFGKTIMALNWMLERACNKPESVCWWVAPVYSQSRVAYRRLVEGLRRSDALDICLKKSDSEMFIEFVNHSWLFFRSAEKYDNLRAEGIHRLVIDEAARVDREAWEAVLRPAISDTKGDVMFISTPKGRNWFYELYLYGKSPDPAWADYQAWSFPTSDNPIIPEKDIEQARKSLPEKIFRQEYLAEFIEEEGEVIPNVDACATLPELTRTREPGRTYYAGIDLARLQDWTVICILDDQLRLVDFERFQGVNWEVQKAEISRIVRQYDAQACVDSTGVGDPIVESLIMEGLAVKGFVFTATSKRALVQNLIFTFASREIQIAPVPELVEELKSLTFRQNQAGGISYQAPEGMHDDCPMALALACWSATKEHWPGIRLI